MKVILNSDASDHMTLFSSRLILIAVAIIYPAFGFILNFSPDDLSDPMSHRLILAFVLLVLYALTYISSELRKHLPKIFFILYAVFSTDIFYSAYLNDLHIAYVSGLTIIICGGSIIFHNFKQLIFYGVYASLQVIFIAIFLENPEYMDIPTFSATLMTAYVVAALMLGVRTNLQKKLLISDRIVKQAQSAIFVFDADGKAVFVNPKISDILGYHQKDLLDDGWWEIFSKDHSNKFEDGKSVLDFIKENIDTINDILETKLSKSNGEKCYIKWNVSILEDGQLLAVGTEITTLKIQERELKKFSHIASNVNDYILITDKNDHVTWVNDSFTKITGYTLEEIAGKRPADVLPGSKTDLKTLEFIEEQIKLKQSFRTEILDEDKDGNEKWLSISTSIITNKRDEIEQFITVGNDITKSRAASELNKELSIVVEHTDNLVIIADKEDKITWVNKAFNTITGFELEEVLGRHPAEVLRGENTNPEDAAYISKQIANKKSFNTQIINYTKEGRQFWMHVVVNIVLDENEEITKFITLGSDVTAYTEAQEKLKNYSNRLTAIHEIDRAMISFKPLEYITEITLKSIFKALPAAELAKFVHFSGEDYAGLETTVLLNENEFETHLRDYPDRSYHYMQELLKGNEIWLEDIQLTDHEYLYNQGVRCYVSVPIFDGAVLTGAVSIGSHQPRQFTQRDKESLHEIVNTFALVMKQKAMQHTILESNEALAIKNDELEYLNDELRQFGYIVSHDLKAPLRGIMSLADFLYQDYEKILDEEGKYQLELLKSRVLRMNYLIEGILQYSRVSNTAPIFEEVNVEQILTSVIDLLHHDDDNVKILVKQSMPSVFADQIRVQQVFQNLIGNAIKYSDEDETIVEVSCEELASEWQFSISDNGSGIDPKHHEKIFKIFQTLKPRDEVESTGIGLTIVKKILDKYGGRIWLESEIGKGTTFYFTFPKNQENT